MSTKQFKFRVKYTSEANLQIDLDDKEQEALKSSDNVLIREYLKSFGIPEYVSSVEHEDWEILHYEEVPITTYSHNVSLVNLDICFFQYDINGEPSSNFVYDNKLSEKEIKHFIISSQQHSNENITIDDIHNLTINR